MSQLEELVVKAIAALRKAEADGVMQTTGVLGREGGCRCAEGVVADMLVDEGILYRVEPPELTDVDSSRRNVVYREVSRSGDPEWRPVIQTSYQLRDVLPHRLSRLTQAQVEGRVGKVVDYLHSLNDEKRLTFGQIADLMEESLAEGFYG